MKNVATPVCTGCAERKRGRLVWIIKGKFCAFPELAIYDINVHQIDLFWKKMTPFTSNTTFWLLLRKKRKLVHFLKDGSILPKPRLKSSSVLDRESTLKTFSRLFQDFFKTFETFARLSRRLRLSKVFKTFQNLLRLSWLFPFSRLYQDIWDFCKTFKTFKIFKAF